MMTKEEAEKKILAHSNVDISPKEQEELNKPLGHPGGLGAEDKIFLEIILDKVKKREIDLYKPNTLFNDPVYESLDENAKAKSELDAFNMLGTIREIVKLHKAGLGETYQMENLVNRMRLTKERLEQAGGDIFII